ncbi:MAG: DUF1592 domain-containing protein [Verrucomicrobiales bacterium]|nr:DUF1592 domain-containing protein [Verrucomicrobiae bacterium]
MKPTARWTQMLACLPMVVFHAAPATAEPGPLPAFLETHCLECHDSDSRKGNLDLTALRSDFANAETFARWVKIHDRITSGEMPPKKKARPEVGESAAFIEWLSGSLIKAEKARVAGAGRTGVRRLTRTEYENTLRDLFDMPGLALQNLLPADGSAHGFDKNSDALDISHVHLAKYLEAADLTLDLAIATQPKAPTVQKRRISLMNRGGFVAHIVMNGDGVLLRDMKPDPDFPASGEHKHIDQGAHEQIGSFETGSTVGLFRHEDESVSPYFMEHVTIYPGHYRVRTSLWAFQWDKGQVLPARGTEAARLSVVQLTGDGRGGQHPSYVLGYYDAPSLSPTEHEVKVWLNHNELIGFNAASLAPVANYNRKGRAMAFTGPGIAVDWLEIEGPLHEEWPPRAHRLLFGELPLKEFPSGEQEGQRPPVRKKVRQLGAGLNRPDPGAGLWSVQSAQPLVDAERLLAGFLPKAFRRPVSPEVRQSYLEIVKQRLKAGDCIETALREAYRAALCSPDFLYQVEPADGLDDYALAARLSYFLWNSAPDDELLALAARNTLHDPGTLRSQTERLLGDVKSQRFIDDFLGQWLKLRQIAANDPDKKLYPEFSPYLQDSMVAETRAYFRELIEKDLDATHLVRSRFAMLNQKLATHYGIDGVIGPKIRRVDLPPGCPRGGFLTQASILKVTANGTTTSPVVRGAFVLDRILGKPPEPPPSSVPAVEPDVRGTTTIREQLDKHRNDAACATCHAKIDPPGFALESFDVIGGQRSRYRSIGEGLGDPAPRGTIDPFIGISFKLGPPVDSAGVMPGGRSFSDIRDMQDILAEHPEVLLHTLARQFLIYSTGRDIAFSDRAALNDLLTRTGPKGGVRSLLHQLIQSPLFQTR